MFEMIISTLIAAVLLYTPYVYCELTGTNRKDLGLFYDFNKKDTVFTLTLTAIILSALTVAAIMWPCEKLPRTNTLFHALDMAGSGLAAAIIEETFFRGFLQPLCEKRLPVWAAVIVTNLIFASAHLITSPNWIALLVFFPGCIMSGLMYRCKNLFPPTLFHFLGNVWAIWFFPMPV